VSIEVTCKDCKQKFQRRPNKVKDPKNWRCGPCRTKNSGAKKGCNPDWSTYRKIKLLKNQKVLNINK